MCFHSSETFDMQREVTQHASERLFRKLSKIFNFLNFITSQEIAIAANFGRIDPGIYLKS